MTHLLQGLAWLVPLVYLVGAAAAMRRRYAWRALAWATAAGLVIAAGEGLGRLLGSVPAGALCPMAGAVMILIAFLGWIIARYSEGNLAGESGERRYVIALLLTLTSVTSVVAARNLLVLILAWAASSLMLHPLLIHYRERPGARMAARKKFLASRLAELALALAAALLYRHWHTLELSRLTSLAAASASAPLGVQIAVALIAAAVLLKSAQLPVHGWLLQVMEAPTSVSALLHAGVINLGGYVLIRLAPLVTASLPAQALLVVVGSTTAALAGMTLMTCPSIKGRLAWSTCSQMGLMAAECGLGLYDLALLHLIGHALYKAGAFLSSGSAVDDSRVRRMAPGAAGPSAAAQLLAVPLAALLAGGSALLWRHLLSAAPIPWIALLFCAFGMATLLSEAAAGPGAALWSVAAAALGMQLYLLWHVAIDRGLDVASVSPAPILALYSAACFLGLYAAQCRIRWPAARDRSRIYAWVAAGYFLDEPLTRLATYPLASGRAHRRGSRLRAWRAQREGGAA